MFMLDVTIGPSAALSTEKIVYALPFSVIWSTTFIKIGSLVVGHIPQYV